MHKRIHWLPRLLVTLLVVTLLSLSAYGLMTMFDSTVTEAQGQGISSCLNRVDIPESELHWIYVPDSASALHTEENYFFLAGELIANGVVARDFNSFGARRGNDRVMTRGTFANIRLKNRLVPGVEGGVTLHMPDGEQASIYEAAMRYRQEGVPLMILAGKEYGTGSSRDWAAKGTNLLGVKAVIAESFERIHRSNLVGMGVLPLQFMAGENAESLGLTGREVFQIRGLDDQIKPQSEVRVKAVREDGSAVEFKAVARLNTMVEVEYYRNGGVLNTVLRKMVES